jgi:predicted phosphoribosyltransferase
MMWRLQRFADRFDAGRRLASRLKSYAGSAALLVLGLPRGGVPVAREVARALGAPLDVMIVRKLGVPGEEELAMGAISSGGVWVMNERVVKSMGIPAEVIEEVAAREQHELERREQLYRGSRPPFDAKGRTVILVDDGIATGATIRAAARALRKLEPARIIIAVPTAPASTLQKLEKEVDEVVCLRTPKPFFAIGESYEDFSQVGDDEVRAMLLDPVDAPARGRHTMKEEL